jgi:Ca2+-dependent lipid-binding protein
MDGWGSLTMLIKRQEAAKNRNATLKYELQKRRESYFKGKNTQELEFPEISNADMKILKEKIRKKYKADKIKNVIINILLFVLVVAVFYYIFSIIKFEF